MTQQYFVYCKENQRSMTEKDSLFGHIDIFQTWPNQRQRRHTVKLQYCVNRTGAVPPEKLALTELARTLAQRQV